MPPELTARYPRAQRCLPQNYFLKWGNSDSKIYELMPLSYCTILLISWLGR
jgi:hypothetical protein